MLSDMNGTCGSPAIERPEHMSGVHCLAMPNIAVFQNCSVWNTRNWSPSLGPDCVKKIMKNSP